MAFQKFEVVIGSWNAYNSGNDKSLGSEWIDFGAYENWDQIAQELTNQGFDLNGADEELFIQDIDFNFGDFSGDYTHPKTLFNLLKNSGVMENETRYKEALAYMQAVSFGQFEELVEKNGENWDSDIIFYDTKAKTSLGMELIAESLPQEHFKWLQYYIDFDRYVDDSDFQETKYGFIEIL